MNEPFCIKKRCKSFYYAIQGIFTLIRSEHNAWIHAFATLIVIIGGLFFQLSRMEWVALVCAITMVWMAEALNTSIEILCNRVSQQQDAFIRKSKDVAAAAVLFAAIGAATIGGLIFSPHILSLISR